MSEVIIVAIITSVSAVLQVVTLRRQSRSEKAQADDRKRMAILLKSSEACLDGVHQLGANGCVTRCLEELREYKDQKAAL